MTCDHQHCNITRVTVNGEFVEYFIEFSCIDCGETSHIPKFTKQAIITTGLFICRYPKKKHEPQEMFFLKDRKFEKKFESWREKHAETLKPMVAP